MVENVSSLAERADAQDRPVRLSRSPHPYHRWSIHEQTSSETQQSESYLPSPSPTPPHGSDTEEPLRSQNRRRGPLKDSPPESGTDPDDEHAYLARALPAPPIRLRKGLRGGDGAELHGQATPLLTPSLLNEESKRLSGAVYFDSKKVSKAQYLRRKELLEAREKFYYRRRAELVRRTSEALSLCSIGYVVLSEAGARLQVLKWQRELICYIAISGFLLCLYPLRLVLRPMLSNGSSKLGALELPATFDPAPVLYPLTLPVLVSLSIASGFDHVVLPNIMLGLSALPTELVPSIGHTGSFNVIHWALTCIPLFFSKEHHVTQNHGLKTNNLWFLTGEALILVYPLHRALLQALYYLTTSSLLSAELQLASVSLINLLVLSNSPQSVILGVILWVGGLGAFITCATVLKWNVALERIPIWKLRRAGRVLGSAATFVNSLGAGMQDNDDTSELTKDAGSFAQVNGNRANHNSSKTSNDSLKAFHSTQAPASSTTRRMRRISDVTKLNMPLASNSSKDVAVESPISPASPRDSGEFSPLTETLSLHKRRLSQSAQVFLSFSPTQAFWRKIAYTCYTYVVLMALILGPVRITIGHFALNDNEPFGWAAGYLLSDMPGFRELVQALQLEAWIDPSDRRAFNKAQCAANWIERYRQAVGLPTTRLLLFSYWAGVIALGLIVVLKGLGPFPEVDTRRKVFHGTMVLMLLPTTYIDPCFLSLGLAMVFVVFLLLDLFRASQLKPLAKPLATFLAPYVDGRDLRGPVIVSHIFLLIGCAIPLWLSLASTARKETADKDPWKGWDLETRDVSMVAGVVCVGMGDAAASLVGRRFGRRKWPWAGGKSLEGSTAFACAVTAGLIFGKAWLDFGGWQIPHHNEGNTDTWLVISGKAALAASGASFTEAVLTGANDNVVVPIILWLLVRGLAI